MTQNTTDFSKLDINMEEPEQADSTPTHGAFKGVISEAEAVPHRETGDIVRVSKNGLKYITIKLSIDYQAGDKTKSRNIWINPGIWFPEEIKTLMDSLGMDKDAAKDPKNYVGKDVGVFIGGKEFSSYQKNSDGTPRHIDNFEGYGVIQFSGDDDKEIKAIDTDIQFFLPYRDINKASYKAKADEFAAAKKRFSESLSEPNFDKAFEEVENGVAKGDDF